MRSRVRGKPVGGCLEGFPWKTVDYRNGTGRYDLGGMLLERIYFPANGYVLSFWHLSFTVCYWHAFIFHFITNLDIEIDI